MELNEIRSNRPKESDPLLGNHAEGSTPFSLPEIRPPDTGGEMTGEDIESAATACCRICLESDTEPGEMSPLLQFDYPFNLLRFFFFLVNHLILILIHFSSSSS